MMEHPPTANNIDALIGARMRTRRRQLNLTQTQVGALLGVSFQQCAKMETGQSRISAAQVLRLCKALEVAPMYFYEGLLGDEVVR